MAYDLTRYKLRNQFVYKKPSNQGLKPETIKNIWYNSINIKLNGLEWSNMAYNINFIGRLKQLNKKNGLQHIFIGRLKQLNKKQ